MTCAGPRQLLIIESHKLHLYIYICLSNVPAVDWRMDSPGFCALNCTYSIMENDNKQAFENIDKRETNRNSVAMQKEGFLRTFEVLCQEVKLTEICTDASPQISALFRKLYSSVLQIWFVVKWNSYNVILSMWIILVWNCVLCSFFFYRSKDEQIER